jgi:AcrR family transcriptional regulator
MARPTKDKKIDLPAEIKATAHKHLAEEGAGGLSLRAIARDLGITAPAIYNYFPRLDDLITALLVDTFEALGDILDAAAGSASEDDFAGRFMAIGLTYRQWAVENPQHYNFIFGNPIPGYHAPEQITTQSARRGMMLLIATIESAQRAGKLIVPADANAFAASQHQQIEAWAQDLPRPLDAGIFYLAVSSWAQVHGLVSLEVHNQLHEIVKSPEQLYHFELENILQRIGLR